jgi:hypothetical protein
VSSQERNYRNCLFVLLAGVFVTFSPRAQEIWLSPQAAPLNTPLHRADDLMDMFEVDAPWKEAASHVTVFQLPASYVGHAPQDEIDNIVADLNRRHIPLALEVGVMNVGPKSTNPPCGGFGQVEGYGTPEWAKSIAQKIKKAGGIIQFVAMDEPLFYGHYFKGRPGRQPGCQSSIDIVVGLVEAPLNVFIAEYPNIIIGDIEPTNIAERPGWKDDISTWVSGFRKTMGRPLAFMHLDIPFNHPREESFAVDFYRYVESLKRQQVIGAIGIIYNGTPSDASDESWTQDAREHIHIIEDKNGLHPDHVLIESWTEYPKHALPDSSPSTLTGLVNFYARRIK